ncbi:NAD(P)H-binding protein [Corynebacterium variabile]|uniref:NAD(P)H-binding protein n=1 Tax=Corynebacterium variabile TaxID=1727 RepID=UPI0037351113
MSDIVIIGGHGRVALLTIPLLVADGNTVTAVVRNRAHIDDVEDAGAAGLVADVETMSTDDLADLLQPFDTVVWSAGAGGGDPERTRAVDENAAVRTMNAAEESDTERFIMVSWAGSYDDHGIPADNPFHYYADAKARADDHLRHSALDWTILGPSSLTDGDSDGIALIPEDRGRTEATSVPRQAVASAIAAAVACPRSAGHTLRFNKGEDAPADVLQDLDLNLSNALESRGSGFE